MRWCSKDRVQDTVGARRIAFDLKPGGPLSSRSTDIPSSPNPPYDGRRWSAAVRQTVDRDSSQGSPFPIAAGPCDMEGGSSGGGWITLRRLPQFGRQLRLLRHRAESLWPHLRAPTSAHRQRTSTRSPRSEVRSPRRCKSNPDHEAGSAGAKRPSPSAASAALRSASAAASTGAASSSAARRQPSEVEARRPYSPCPFSRPDRPDKPESRQAQFQGLASAALSRPVPERLRPRSRGRATRAAGG